jgi:hypothetical protein
MISMPSLTGLPLAVQVIVAIGISMLLMSYGLSRVLRALATLRAATHPAVTTPTVKEPPVTP